MAALTQHNEQSGCLICSQTLCAFDIADSQDRTLRLGTVNSFLTSTCPGHNEMIRTLSYEDQVEEYAGESVSLTVKQNSTSGRLVFLSQKNFASLLLVEEHDGPATGNRARILSPDKVDGELLLGWKTACTATHESCTAQSAVINGKSDLYPKYLIDTHQKCIVSVQNRSGVVSYVALSYVWGQIRMLRTNKNNLKDLSTPEALSESMFGGLLPETIRDAMAVTQCLGERYLWVDSLCIVQDDDDHLKYEISHMHQIYRLSSVTIVAADGLDANHGLRGFSRRRTSRRVRQKVFKLGHHHRLASAVYEPRVRRPNTSQNTYYDRAWTFQEFMFSVRRLVFENDSVRWECREKFWYEDILPCPGEDEPLFLESEHTMQLCLPRITSVEGIGSDFNQKTLTYPEDAMLAFAGLQSRLTELFPSGMIYGIPESLFEIGLLWLANVEVTRRQSSQAHAERPPPNKLPSWSWLGWHGMFYFFDDSHPNNHGQGSKNGIRGGFTEPVTAWYIMESPSSTDRRRIRSDWHEHIRVSGDVEPLSAANMPNLDQYLFCTTKKTFLVVDPRFGRRCGGQAGFGSTATSCSVDLCDFQESPVGKLYLHSEFDVRYFMFCKPTERRIELVAVAKGWCADLVGGHISTKADTPLGTSASSEGQSDCYFVLWVEWTEGVAYRKGCGVVEADYWEREDVPQPVDLVLG